MEGPWECKIPERLHHVGGTHTAGVCKQLGSTGRTHTGEVHGGGLCPLKRLFRSEQMYSCSYVNRPC